ncbi:calcium-binding protein, partial [Aestuariispira insulae]
NNIMVRIGDADGTKQAVNMPLPFGKTYRALEGVQVVIGNRNLIYNRGQSNDVILAIDPKIKLDFSKLNPFPTKEEYKDSKESGLPFTGTNKTFLGRIANFFYNPKEDFKWAGVVSKYQDEKKKYQEAQEKKAEQQANAQPAKTYKEKLNDALTTAKDAIKNASGNVVFGGQGADVIMAIGKFNVVFADTWSSMLDFSLNALQSSKNQEIKLTERIPVLGPVLKDLGLSGKIKLQNMTLGDAVGLEGEDDGGVSPQSPEQVGQNWASAVSKSFEFKFTMPGMQYLGNVFTLINSSVNLGLGDTANRDHYQNSGAQNADHFRQLGGRLFENSSFKPFGMGEDTERMTKGQGDYAEAGAATGINPNYMDEANMFPMVGSLPDLGLWAAIPEWSTKLWDYFSGSPSTDGSFSSEMQEYFTKSGFLKEDGDLIFGVGQANILFGGAGADMAFMLGETNIYMAGNGNDTAIAIGHDNRLFTGGGDDMLLASGAENLIDGGDGNDVLLGLGLYNRVSGGKGEDFVMAVGSENRVNGGDGDDMVVSIGDWNEITGGEGNDFLIGIGYQNTYRMGGGVDYILNFGRAGVQYMGTGKDILVSAGAGNVLFGESDDDVIIGHADGNNNVNDGGAGNDTLYLGGTASDFWGDSGQDTFVVTEDVKSTSVMDLQSEDRLVIGSGLSIDQLWFKQANDDLVIEIDRWDQATQTTAPIVEVGTVTVKDWFTGTGRQTALAFDYDKNAKTAKQVSTTDIISLVTAMAGFTRGSASAGFMACLTTAEKATLDAIWSNAATATGYEVQTA